MSYQEINERLKLLNQASEPEIEIIESPILEHPLLPKYKKQEEKLQALNEELKIYQKRRNFAKEKIELSKNLTPTFADTKEKHQKVPNINLHDLKELEIELQKSESDLTQTKKYYITLLYQEALEIEQIIKDEQNKDVKENWKQEIINILQIINWIQNYKIPETEVHSYIEQNELKNQLVFLTSPNGRTIPLDELLTIPIEQRKDFEILLLSIKDGTLKGYKKLHKSKLCEVSLNLARIIMRRLNQNTYLIASCFLKKELSSNHYKEGLKNLDKKISNLEDTILTLLNNPYFIEEQNKIEEEFLTNCQKKRDDHNDETRCRIKKCTNQ